MTWTYKNWRFMIVSVWSRPQIWTRLKETSYDLGPFRLKKFH